MVQRRGKDARIKVIGGEVTFSFDDPQETEFAKIIEHFGKNVKNWTPIFDEFSPYMLRSIDRTFASQGRPGKWAALSPNTIKDRMRKGYGRGPILQRSGKLRRGFKTKSTPRTFKIWNSVFYFPYHQFGAPKANIPARKMIVLLAQDKAMFTRIARKKLRE